MSSDGQARSHPPAWGYIVAAAAFGFLAWLMWGDTSDRRPFLDWIAAAFAVVMLASGVREWVTTGSPTARREMTDAEAERDESFVRRFSIWQGVRYAVLVVVVVAAGAIAALRG